VQPIQTLQLSGSIDSINPPPQAETLFSPVHPFFSQSFPSFQGFLPQMMLGPTPPFTLELNSCGPWALEFRRTRLSVSMRPPFVFLRSSDEVVPHFSGSSCHLVPLGVSLVRFVAVQRYSVLRIASPVSRIPPGLI